MYSLGTDPELFLQDTNGDFKSAHEVFEGTKENPKPTDFGAIQVDGVAIEFNTLPSTEEDDFINKINSALTYIKQESSKFGLTYVVTPTAYFNKVYFNKLPHKQKLLGCAADYNVYSGVENPPPGTTLPFRTGAGHIHIGYDDLAFLDDRYEEKVQEIVKQLDSYLYFKSFTWDSDENRRILYGKIGSFRYKSYGVEYRPLSNMWLSSTSLQRKVFQITKKSLEDYDKGICYYKNSDVHNICEQTYYHGTPKDKINDYLVNFEKEFNL